MTSDGLRTRPSRDNLRPRQARVVGAAGVFAAAAVPVILWHHAMSMVASDFHFELNYLISGWTGFALIGLSLALALPVVWSIGRDPEGRFYPRSRNAYAGWSASLYVLGMALASQVGQIVAVH